MKSKLIRRVLGWVKIRFKIVLSVGLGPRAWISIIKAFEWLLRVRSERVSYWNGIRFWLISTEIAILGLPINVLRIGISS